METKKLSLREICDIVYEPGRSPRDQIAGAKVVDLLKQQVNLVDADDQFDVGTLLARELVNLQRMKEAEGVHKQLVEFYPEYSKAWSDYGQFFVVSGDLGRSAEMMDEAVRVATSYGEFVIMMLCERARVARYSRDWQALSSTVQSLIDYRRKPGSKDYIYECDFLSGLPKGVMDEVLCERYITLCKDKPNRWPPQDASDTDATGK